MDIKNLQRDLEELERLVIRLSTSNLAHRKPKVLQFIDYINLKLRYTSEDKNNHPEAIEEPIGDHNKINLPNEDEIDEAASENATRIHVESDNVGWYAMHHGFTDGVEWLKNKINEQKNKSI